MTTTPTSTPGPVTWLADRRAASGLALMVAGLAVLAVPVTLVSKYGTEFLPTVILTGALGLLWLAAGVWQRARTPNPGRAADEARYLLLAVGGLTGLVIALLGAALAYQWWDFLVDWLRLGKREGAWRVLLALAVLLAGLAVMFLSLQTARTEERASVGLRRLLYGYNAVLTGLLLLMILAVVNVLVSLKYAGVIDATQSGQYTLSDRTVNVLKGLDHPVHLYVIWPSDEEPVEIIRTLLSNFEDRSPQVKVEYVSPVHDQMRMRELARTFPRKIDELRGILIVNGEEKPENATFLKENDLFAEEGFGPGAAVKFRGEDKIVAAITGAGGKGKTIVYFTQGAGEPDLNNTDPSSDKGLGVLRDRLTARGTFDVRPLRINPADPKVPDDASVVVVANPKPPVEPTYVRALRQYLIDRRGKGVFLFDVPDNPDLKAMPPTGLEGLLGEFNVDVTNARILTVRIEAIGGGRGVINTPELATVEIGEEARRTQNELAKAFGGEPLQFYDARVVRPATPPRNPLERADVLLTTRPGAAVWTETDPSVNPYQVIQQIDRDETLRKKKLSDQPLPAAVLVTDMAPPAGMPGQPPPESKPRLAVFGDTTFISNVLTGQRSRVANSFAFFASTLDWLGERPTSIGIESRALPVYAPDPDANLRRMIWLPLLVAIVTVVGLGAGVWVVRRR